MRSYVPVPETGTTAGPAARPASPSVLASIGQFISATAEWLGDRLDAAHRREAEIYLAQATDNIDLEKRIRQLERGAFFARYY
jgi:hypothetical protein